MNAQIAQATKTEVSGILSIRQINPKQVSLFFESKEAFETAKELLYKQNLIYSVVHVTYSIALPVGTAVLITV